MKADIDRDELGTLALTCLICVVLLGVPLLVSLGRVMAVGLSATTSGSTDRLVVFGKRLVGDQPDYDYRARLTTAARLVEGKGSVSILILGGRTGDSRLTEAETGEQMLRGLSGGRDLSIGLEQASRDTLANLRNVRELLAKSDARGPLTLVSNRYHLARIGQMAASLGLTYELCAAEDILTALRPASMHRWLSESFYVTWFTTGKLWARLTRNRRMLARIT